MKETADLHVPPAVEPGFGPLRSIGCLPIAPVCSRCPVESWRCAAGAGCRPVVGGYRAGHIFKINLRIARMNPCNS